MLALGEPGGQYAGRVALMASTRVGRARLSAKHPTRQLTAQQCDRPRGSRWPARGSPLTVLPRAHVLHTPSVVTVYIVLRAPDLSTGVLSLVAVTSAQMR